MYRSLFVNSCRINHFGIKPVNGGSPPNESSVISSIVMSRGDFVQLRASDGMEVDEQILSVKNSGRVRVI